MPDEIEIEIEIEIEDLIEEEKPNFGVPIIGNFGSFHTKTSFEVNYLLTSMNFKQLDDIEVASDAFTFEQVNFDEMIQREVDESRVNNEIVTDYLESPLKQALFFPPLIVSIVAFDDNDVPLHKYENSLEKINPDGKIPIFTKRWDRHFEIEFPIVKNGFDYYNSSENGELKIYPHAAKLKLDKSIVKLVIIDGQHRYKAIQEYLRRHPDENKFLNIPVCICFSPQAMEKNGPEDILDTLRNMFVTINNTGKRVSGHYLDLLNDNSLASQTVRLLANKWKKENDDPLQSKLQFLEWNQRSDSKARRVNRAHSITTVSMLCESLRKSVFLDSKDVDFTYNLLGLSEYKNELSTDQLSVYDISEKVFSHQQKTILYEIIENRLIEPIEILLTSPSVYKSKIDSYKLAIDETNQKSLKGDSGYPTFITLMKNFGDIDVKRHTEKAKDASDKFYNLIKTNEHQDNYTRLVFNQAYFRSWASIASISPFICDELANFTHVFVNALETVAFDERRKTFSKSRSYNQNLLYKGGKPNVTLFGKDCWLDLVMMSLLGEQAQQILKSYFNTLANSGIIIEKFNAELCKANHRFMERLFDEILKDNRKNWHVKEYPLSFRNQLSALKEAGDEESIKTLETLLKDKTFEIYKERKELLSNVVDVDYSQLGLF
ncbi:hypothetical protein HWV03_14580 [Moritella sp. 36]|uniref:DNA sulfur modification protein DndB n=1 Tax=Moritella sp. 36 TaxID=2746233 RepID=UPI001BA51F16|nr:DNA sulfur modification protein DndB [Moritella sp. 36]QUM89943.1 hypothetical protein HWV03_14580 [Moritella sp. 36]